MRKNISIIFMTLLFFLMSMYNVKAITPTTITENPKTIIITKEIREVTNPVNVTFEYSITPYDSNPAPVTILPNILPVVFKDALPDSNSIVSSTTILDMSSVIFTKVGDYKFKVTETSTSDSNYSADSKIYYVYVGVRNELASDNKTPTGNLIAILNSQATANDKREKEDIKFITIPNFTYVQLSKKVTNKLGDTNKYFKFEVIINGPSKDKYKIIGSHSIDGMTDVLESSYIAGKKQYIYLKHNQSITIGKDGTKNQIPVGSKWKVVEHGASNYRTYINNSLIDSKSTNKKTMLATTQENFNINNKVIYVNDKGDIAQTGLFINIWPFILLLILSIIGVYIIWKTSKDNRTKI